MPRSLRQHATTPVQRTIGDSSAVSSSKKKQTKNNVRFAEDINYAKESYAPRCVAEDNGGRMFEYFKAQVEILDSTEDDKLAAAMYGNCEVKRSKHKRTSRSKKQSSSKDKDKPKKKKAVPVSGYNFDALIDREESSSSSYSSHMDIYDVVGKYP